MASLIITLIFIALASAGLFFTGMFRVALDAVFIRAYRYHLKLCRDRRPPRVFLIRHGESKGNLDHTLYSTMPDSEIELTEAGLQQAIEAGKKLRSFIGIENMYVYMSPYTRSLQTWQNIKEAFAPSQILMERQDPRLREIELGNLNNAENLAKEIELQMRAKRFFYRFSGGESPADVYDRASDFLFTLLREMDNGYHDHTQNIVIVSHGLSIKFFLMRYFRWNVTDLATLRHMENCEIVRLHKLENGEYELMDDLHNPRRPAPVQTT